MDERKLKEFEETCNESIRLLEEIWKVIETKEIKNTQFVINWLDKINELSVRN